MSVLLASLIVAAAQGEVVFASPTFDRWNYPFNATPGARSVGSTFSSYGTQYNFDDRDGEVLLGFATGSEIEADLAPSSYRVVSCEVTIAIASDDIPYDPTPDSRETHEADGPADADPGRPTHLSGVAFRNDLDGWTFGEDGPFGGSDMGTRTCYPIDFLPDGTARDIASNLTGGFDPAFFAIAQAEVAAGELIPQYGVVTFAVYVDDVDVQCYLRTSLSDGLMEFMVTSLHLASEPGSGGGSNYPDWILKENVLVDLGYAQAASLTLTVEVVPSSGVPGDATGDGIVNVADLLAVLEGYGRCPCCPADLDGSGIVDVDDVLAVIAGWGA